MTTVGINGGTRLFWFLISPVLAFFLGENTDYYSYTQTLHTIVNTIMSTTRIWRHKFLQSLSAHSSPISPFLARHYCIEKENGTKNYTLLFLINVFSVIFYFRFFTHRGANVKAIHWNPSMNARGTVWRVVCFDSSAMVIDRTFIKPLHLKMFHGQPIFARMILPYSQHWKNKVMRKHNHSPLPQKAAGIPASPCHRGWHLLQKSQRSPHLKAHVHRKSKQGGFTDPPQTQQMVRNSPSFLPPLNLFSFKSTVISHFTPLKMEISSRKPNCPRILLK